MRDRLVTASQELQRCDRLIAVEEHVKLIGDVLHIPSLLLSGPEQAVPAERDPTDENLTPLGAFLASDRELILRDQQECLLERQKQSESWHAALADALQAPYEDRGWIIRADARASALQQELDEQVRQVHEAERRLAAARRP